jgi:hypothetical protein
MNIQQPSGRSIPRSTEAPLPESLDPGGLARRALREVADGSGELRKGRTNR